MELLFTCFVSRYVCPLSSQITKKRTSQIGKGIIGYDFLFTRDSEVIIFSPCVFVCIRHYVCPDDLDMKDW